jgi:hypothetical protein
MKSNNRAKLFATCILFCFIGFLMYIFIFAGNGKNFENECHKKCSPRFSRVLSDPAYLPAANGKKVPLICECY